MSDWIDKIHELKSMGLPFAIATVVDTGGSAPREVGAKMVIESTGLFHGTVGGGMLEKLTLEAATEAIANNASKIHNFPLGAKTAQCCGGVVDVFIEVHSPGRTLHLFGAGHVGLEVIQVLKNTPFSVLVHDDRPEWRERARVLGARVSELDCLKFAQEHDFRAQDTAAVLTHSHDLDLELVAVLSRKSIQYLGLIGSQSKWTRFQQRLKDRDIPEAYIQKIECPLGIPIGGKSPREVAISLAARLLQVLHAR